MAAYTFPTNTFDNSTEGTHVVVAHGVHVVLQVTLSVVWQDDASQFAIASEVEAGISGEHQQAGHVPPADLIL